MTQQIHGHHVMSSLGYFKISSSLGSSRGICVVLTARVSESVLSSVYSLSICFSLQAEESNKLKTEPESNKRAYTSVHNMQ